VSSYPNLDEAPAETQAFEIDGLPGPRTDAPTPSGKSTDALIAAADAGADLTSLASVERGSPVSVQAPVRHRLAEAFEALRDASDDYQHRTGQRPRVFLANLGTAADYTARTTFCKSYVEAGGLQAMAEEVTADTAAAAFTLSGAGLALICSSDKIYDASAEAVAKALIAADAKSVVLAGKPGDQEARWREAGIDRFIFAGDDALATLRDLAQCLGVIEMGVIEN
jgi:methylmalonyl-CoA mutase